jgi:Lrp/AsnC family transcriptional regulator for asnA, asnC and gidA
MGAALMKRVDLDELDLKIIERLGEDARVSNREIARDFGLTEGTIRARLKRLTQTGTIKVSAVINSAVLKNPVLAYLFVEADSADHVDGVALALAAVPEISFVATLLGRCDILAMTLISNGHQLTELLHSTIDGIPGVHRVQYSLGQQFIKHDYRWCVLPQSEAEHLTAPLRPLVADR